MIREVIQMGIIAKTVLPTFSHMRIVVDHTNTGFLFHIQTLYGKKMEHEQTTSILCGYLNLDKFTTKIFYSIKYMESFKQVNDRLAP